MTDWYENRHELKPGMVFKDFADDIVKLDRRVAGDGTNWYVLSWYPGRPDVKGYEKGGWVEDDVQLHPGDLVERLSDSYPD